MKFRGVFDSVGMADWVVDGRTTGTEDAVASIAKLYHERNARQPELARQAAANKTALQDAFASLLGRPAINQSMPY
jgi:hypothetical protein